MMPLCRLNLWVTVFLVALLAMLAATAPAALPASLIEMATAGRLKMVSSAGGAWHGVGFLTTAGQSTMPTQPLAISWTTDFGSVYRGEVVLQINFGEQPVQLTATPSRWRVDAAGVHLPMPFLRPFFPRLVANSNWTGDVEFTATGLGQTWAGGDGTGSARLDVKSLAVAEFSATPLGSYRLNLTPEANSVRLALTTLSGPLSLEGKGAVDRSRMSCEARAQLNEGASAELGKILSHIARREGDKTWHLSCPG
jgi:general secretion pathway protein N